MSALKRTLPYFSALLIALIFVELGIWQLHRAQEMHKPVSSIEQPTVALSAITAPGINLKPSAANRIVTVKGTYKDIFTAPNQNSLALEVRLLNINGESGILVVRGAASTSRQNLSGSVTITGRLYPRQSSDHATNSANALSRLDPALITNATELNLYDGYIIAQSEKNEYGQEISADRIPTPVLTSGTPGYYWQHLAYVVIWWLMALLVLCAPFYNRLKDRIGI
jgi:cytochrome oxidase assembly protein ShyY1